MQADCGSAALEGVMPPRSGKTTTSKAAMVDPADVQSSVPLHRLQIKKCRCSGLNEQRQRRHFRPAVRTSRFRSSATSTKSKASCALAKAFRRRASADRIAFGLKARAATGGSFGVRPALRTALETMSKRSCCTKAGRLDVEV